MIISTFKMYPNIHLRKKQQAKKFTGIWTFLVTWSNHLTPKWLLRRFDRVPTKVISWWTYNILFKTYIYIQKGGNPWELLNWPRVYVNNNSTNKRLARAMIIYDLRWFDLVPAKFISHWTFEHCCLLLIFMV